MIDLKGLIALSQPPENSKGDWLSKAEAGVDFLQQQALADETIIFASLPNSLVHAVLAPRENVSPPDHDDLLNAMFMQDRTWAITHSSGGGRPDRVYLAPPLDSFGCHSLLGGENLVVRRRFESVDKGPVRTEVSQKLVHALNLFRLEEEKAYCRLDDNGDVEPVLKVISLEKQTGRESDIVITIKAHDLARYMVVTNTVVVSKFDFTRVDSSSFVQWADLGEYRERGPDLFYTAASQAGASYANGILLSRPRLTHDDLVHEHRLQWDRSAKQYAKFKAYDWKNRRLEEISCAPTALASYFEAKSPLPFQITPAFFRPEVLQRYKADREKYTLEHRSITSRAGWHLKTYDINEEGQVHTYLRYLADLPYQEQIYWQSFNEWPKGSISKRAFQTDIQGEWTDVPDPLVELIREVRTLDEEPPDWWIVRGGELRSAAHYPITTSPDEWGDSILALDQLLVEGLAVKAIRARLANLGRQYQENWASLKLLQELLAAQGVAVADAANAIEPLRQLHSLRSKVKGHAAEATRRQLTKEARTEHGSLKEHFRQLAFGCQESFRRARSALSECS